jgi:hypothetical protein
MGNIGDAAFSDGDIMRRLRTLEQHVRELNAGRRLENATVGAGGVTVKGTGGVTLTDGGDLTVEGGGDITVEGGGEFRVIHESGDNLLAVHRGSSGQYIGNIALSVQTHSNGEQFWAFWDNEQNVVVSDDAQSGKGLARPWLPVVLYTRFDRASAPIGYATISASDIASEQLLWEGRASVSHPFIVVDGVWGQASGSNSCAYRLEVGSSTVGTWNETGLTVGTRGPFDVSQFVGDDFSTVKLFADASGTGLVACQVLACYLRQS